MAFIIEIANKLKKKTDVEEYKKELRKWKPEILEKGSYTVPAFIVPKTRDKKQLNEFRKILTFIKEKAQFIRMKNECTLMAIPTTSDTIVRLWSNGSRGIRKMEEIGLIRIYGSETKNRAKRFMYFYDVEQQFINYCKKNGIEPISRVNCLPRKVSDKANIIPIRYKEKALITSNTRLYVPEGVSLNEFRDQIFEWVYENYPELKEIQKLSDEINEKYYKDKPEFAISCELKVKWNERPKKKGVKKKRCITKIKFRATNSYSCLEESERHKLLDSLGYKLASDVNCSVPRLNLSMNLGKWFSKGPNAYFDVDLYELIFNEMYPGENYTSEDRKALKKLLLRTFFEDSPGNLNNHIWKKLDHEGLNKMAVYGEMMRLNQAIRKVVGPLMLGTNVYYVEACVYLRVLKSLLDMGYKVWLVYDCFYANGCMMDDLFDAFVKGMIEDEFNSFYKRYIKGVKKGIGVRLGE